ncbi:MAG: hypothetical protein EXS14_06635 [Planctomycetes bacterium]|nr:hypothetical protein [Planctomycetota bacterium]
MTPRRAVFFTGLALALSVWIAAWHGGLSNEFGSIFFGANGAGYDSRIAINLATKPLELTRFGAPWFVLEAEQPWVQHYSNHPPGYMLLQGALYAIFGTQPLVLKLFALCVHVGTALLLMLFFLPHRPGAAAVAGVLAATLHIAAHYGFMCSAFGICTLLLSASLLLWSRHTQQGDRASLHWLCTLAFFNAWLDWNGLVVLPCFVAAALLQRRHALAKLLALSLLAAVVALVLHCAYVLGGFDALLHEVRRLVGTGTQEARGGNSGWWITLGNHCLTQFGWAALGLAALGFVQSTAGMRALLLLAVAPGLLLVFGLQAHAAVHEYWIQPLLPAIVLAAACGAERFLCSQRKIASLAAAAGITLIALYGLRAASTSLAVSLTPDGAQQMARAIELIAAPEDVVLLPFDYHETVGGYTDRQVIVGVDTLAEVNDITAAIKARRPTGRVIMVLPSPWKDPAFATALEIRAPSRPHGAARVHVLLTPH